MKKFFKIILIFFIFIIFIHLILLLFFGFHDNVKKSDLIVVFGNKVELNWEVSNRLKTRLDKALELYRGWYSEKILVSWWLWKEWFYEWSVMKDYLVDLWVSEGDIFVDNEWNNTQMTIINTKRVLEKNNLESIIIVSHYYHMMRARMAFLKAWVSEVGYASADLALEFRDLYSIPREVVGYYVYLLRW